MKIKNRLSLYFTLIGSGVLLVVMIALYVSVYTIVTNHFYTQLKDRANIVAQLYLEADEITPDSLNNIRNKFIKNLPGEVVRLYDYKNSAAFISDKQQHWDTKIIETVRKRKYLQYTNNNYQIVGLYYKDNQGNFVILVSASDVDGKHQLASLQKTMLVLFLILAITLFLVSRWLATKTLSPIKGVIEQMQLIKAHNLNLRINVGNGKDEISELAHNFNRLLAHLENAFELQRTYVANASHELRTPITSIIGEVELALNKERTLAENQQTLQLVLEEAEKLIDTISGLMELAQVDMDYTIARQTPVRVDELLWDIKEYWANKAGAGLLKINIEQMPENEAMLTIPANYQLLFIAVNNIIGNAFKFSNQQAVKLNFYADGSIIRIQVIDGGIGIPLADMGLIFKSFYRGNNSHAFAGNGIGLYVTQKIIQLFNGTLKLESIENESTTATIQFKV